MDIESQLTPEKLELFLKVFYGDLRQKRLHKKRFVYHSGNTIKKIESMHFKECVVANEKQNIKEDSIVVKFRNKDDIPGTFVILLKNLKRFDFGDDSIKKKKEHVSLPSIYR